MPAITFTHHSLGNHITKKLNTVVDSIQVFNHECRIGTTEGYILTCVFREALARCVRVGTRIDITPLLNDRTLFVLEIIWPSEPESLSSLDKDVMGGLRIPAATTNSLDEDETLSRVTEAALTVGDRILFIGGDGLDPINFPSSVKIGDKFQVQKDIAGADTLFVRSGFRILRIDELLTNQENLILGFRKILPMSDHRETDVEIPTSAPTLEPEESLALHVGSSYINRSDHTIPITHVAIDPDTQKPFLFYDDKGRWYLPNGRLHDTYETQFDLLTVAPTPRALIIGESYWGLYNGYWLILTIIRRDVKNGGIYYANSVGSNQELVIADPAGNVVDIRLEEIGPHIPTPDALPKD